LYDFWTADGQCIGQRRDTILHPQTLLSEHDSFLPSAKEVSILKTVMQFNLTSEDEAILVTYILTANRSVGLESKTVDVEYMFLQMQRKEREILKNLSTGFCVLVIIQNTNKECNCSQAKTLKTLLLSD
jgi:hypothetical protein